MARHLPLSLSLTESPKQWRIWAIMQLKLGFRGLIVLLP
jgi:hypothetical protein